MIGCLPLVPKGKKVVIHHVRNLHVENMLEAYGCVYIKRMIALVQILSYGKGQVNGNNQAQ